MKMTNCTAPAQRPKLIVLSLRPVNGQEYLCLLEIDSRDAAVFSDKGEHLLVTELFGSSTTIPSSGAGALSSYEIATSGHLVSISSHIGDGETAACWIALEPTTGKYVYVSNNLSASISSYSVGTGGSVTLLNGSAAKPSGPNDLATAEEGGASFLYVVAAGSGTVGAFQIDVTNGSLTEITGSGVFPGFPTPQTTFPQGIAAY
jgi:6-phosphogluconolactonase